MPDDASTLFDAWLDRLEAGEEPDFEGVVARHPEHAPALRALHRDWQSLRSSLESALPGALPGESFFRDPAAAAEPVPRAPPPEPGQVLGDFRLVRPLGQGGMGAVWEAEQLSLGRRVALKLLRPGRGAPRLLLREARVAGRLDHPGLVPVHAVGEAGGVTFIAQQLVGDGYTLADVLDRVRRLDAPPPDWFRHVAELLAQVADAVHAAHEAGVLHRDLKPQNVLIDDEDRPRVTDFGLAHAAADGEVARPGLLGTLAYMSPEQAAGADIEIDRRSDVFSLGAVLWEALTLRRAFEGDTAQAVLDAVLHEDPPDPRRIRPRVPRDLAAICAKALRKPREQRYASLRELADDLRRFLRNEPVQAEPEPALALAWKWSLRHPAWSAGLASGALALLVISGLLVREIDLRRDAQDARDAAAGHASAAETAATLADRRAAEARRQSYLANLRAADAALQQEGWAEAARLLAACPEEHRGWEWRHLALRSQASLLTLDSGSAPVRAVAMTPDGRRFVTGCADGSVHAWDGESGARLGVLTGHEGAVNAVAITDDGARAVTGGQDGTLRVWDVEHGRDLPLRLDLPAPVLALAADAAGALVAAGCQDGTARVWRLDGSAPIVLEPMLRAAVTSLSLLPDGSRLVTGTSYGTAELWDAATGEYLARLAPYEAAPLALSPDGALLASGGQDGMLRVRSTDTAAMLFERRAHDGAIAGLAFSRDGSRLLTLSVRAGEIRAFDARDGAPAGVRRGHAGTLACLATDATGTRVVAGGSPGTAWLWRHGDGPEGPPLPRLPGPVLALAADRAGTRVLAAALGGTPRLLDLTGAPLAPLDGAGGTPTAVALDASGSLAALATFQEPVVNLLDTSTGSLRARLAGPRDGITDLSLSADGATLLAAAQDGRLYVWSLPDGALRATLEGHRSLVSSAKLSADGRRAASASVDGTVRLWDVASGVSRTLTAAGWYEDALVALSADGALVASASIHADAASVWNADTGELLCTLPGHGTGVGALALSPDGARVLSASARDHAVRVWDARTGDLLVLLSGHAAPVTALAASGDGERVLSGAGDGELRVWEAGAGGR